ncbi:MAG: hypothetical protein IPK00_11825 [Deltaproteobacteria bacterium]|nr:hypothetical protein [Deltaproteobacteria bacterium]
MTQPNSVSIPIEYRRRVQVIEAECVADPDEVTLRELVEAVAEYSDSEREVVATVMHMLRTGAVKLQGVYEEPQVAKLCG